MSDSPVPIPIISSNAACYACGESFIEDQGLPFAAVLAGWAPSQASYGERYLLSLCKACFQVVLGDLKLQRRVRTMFDDTDQDLEGFGQVGTNAPDHVTFGECKS